MLVNFNSKHCDRAAEIIRSSKYLSRTMQPKPNVKNVWRVDPEQFDTTASAADFIIALVETLADNGVPRISYEFECEPTC